MKYSIALLIFYFLGIIVGAFILPLRNLLVSGLIGGLVGFIAATMGVLFTND